MEARSWTMLTMVVGLLIVPTARAAFEQAAESPWLQGGAASCVFPVSPMTLFHNPASLGLLEGPGLSASASRPFGLSRLDRGALAGGMMWPAAAAGAGVSLTGDGSYTEATISTALAWRISGGLALGLGGAVRLLRISSYGRATGFSADMGAVWSPVDGVYSAAAFRGVVRTGLGDSGDPACPQVLEAGIGIVPAQGVTLAMGVSRQERLDPEISVATSFSPASPVSLGAGLLTDPARFWATLTISLGKLDMGYGYSAHPTLPGSNLAAVCWGGCGSAPQPVDWGGRPEEEEGTTPFEFPLDINRATEEQLLEIPGIGPARASAIVSWMEENGPVTSIDQLIDVPGIGPAMLETLEDWLVAE